MSARTLWADLAMARMADARDPGGFPSATGHIDLLAAPGYAAANPLPERCSLLSPCFCSPPGRGSWAGFAITAHVEHDRALEAGT